MTDTLIVALSVDKVQTLLTETIHAHVQEHQTEEATLKNIVKASKDISENFKSIVKLAFTGVEMQELLSCSGVYIFSCNYYEDIVESKLNQLFLKYYYESHGQKLLRCCTFFMDSSKRNFKLDAIQKAKKNLKNSKYFNMRIKKNQQDLFSFNKVDDALNETKKLDQYSMFAKDINDLYDDKNKDNKNHFRIAVIKADLDGMGNMFKNIHNFEDYSSISNTLNNCVSLENLHTCCIEETSSQKIFPFYIAGDDVFFAVSISNLLYGIRVCERLLSTINLNLTSSNIKVNPLTMSIGVAITFNREPIRYYMEMADKQLSNAKLSKNQDLDKSLRTKISIYDLTFYTFSGKVDIKKYGHINYWKYLLKNVETLNSVKNTNEHVGNPSFFYNLLKRLLNKDVQVDNHKYLNSILYHFLPSDSEKGFSESEMLLYNNIIRELLHRDVKQESDIENILKPEDKKHFESYLRLMLLFSDPRFSITKPSDTHAKYSKNKNTKKKGNIKKYVFDMPIDYLYHILYKKDEDLTSIFINILEDKKWPYFQRLKIEKSMFFKIHNIISKSKRDIKSDNEKIAKMITLKNEKLEKNAVNGDKVDISTDDTNNHDSNTSQNHFYFDVDKFQKIANETNCLTTDYMDSVMLLYEYKKMASKKNKKGNFKGGYHNEKNKN